MKRTRSPRVIDKKFPVSVASWLLAVLLTSFHPAISSVNSSEKQCSDKEAINTNKKEIEHSIGEVEFSHESGFFETGFVLTLSHYDEDAVILYTTDGSVPCISNIGGINYPYKQQYPQYSLHSLGDTLFNVVESKVYDAPIEITNRNLLPNKISSISTTWDANPTYLPSFPVDKATVIRAMAVVNDSVTGPVTTHTFFVFDDPEGLFQRPVFSISINENDLFDYYDGIYVAGVDFDQWRLQNPSLPTSHISTPANFQRRGDETEKTAFIQYFTDQNKVVSQQAGVRVHGGGSRFISNKGLRFYARSDYDEQNSIDFPFFGPDNDESFKRIIMRPDGRSDNATTNFIRDAALQNIVSQLNFDTQSHTPFSAFINGEYWGFYWLVTRYDKHYFKRVYGIDENDLDYLVNNSDVVEGDTVHFRYMYNFVAQNDMSVTENYEYLKKLVDIDNFMDYHISQIYLGNYDWPGNNINYFRRRVAEFDPDAPAGHDGRWRWVMADLDHGFGATRPVSFNNLRYATTAGSTSWANYDWATLLLRKILENKEFQTLFITRFSDLINTTFHHRRVNEIIDHYAQAVEPEVERHIKRWNRLSSINQWRYNVQLLRNFANARPEIQRNHIREHFDLGSMVDVKIDIAQPRGGFVQVNTIVINAETPGAGTEPYPWKGKYFSGHPLIIKALPFPGYRFSHWSGTLESNSTTIATEPLQSMELTAHFELTDSLIEPQLLHFWLMDTNIPNDSPLDGLRASYSPFTAPAYLYYKSSLAGYPYYPGHSLWRKASMERRNAPTEVNYRAEALEETPFGQSGMRGMQIKQPFRTPESENTLFFQIPTHGYREIKFSFAAMDEGAVGFIKIDYLDPHTNRYTTSYLSDTIFPITDQYQLYQVDLRNVKQAADNDNFIFRLRFMGDNLESDNGNRVTFNNLAVEGTLITGNCFDVSSLNCPDPITITVYQTFRSEVTGGLPGDISWKVIDELERMISWGEGTSTNDMVFGKPGNYFVEFNSLNSAKPPHCWPEIARSCRQIIQVEDPVSVNTFTTDNSPEIYPNPASEYLFVTNIPEEINNQIQIFDVSGRLVKEKILLRGQNETILETSHLNSGVYVLVVRNNQETYNTVFIIR